MASKPLQRSLETLREAGFKVAITEKWNQFAHIRQDLFGCFDAVAVKADVRGVLGINACTDDGKAAAHVHKYEGDPDLVEFLKVWLGAGNRFEIWAWGKRGSAGKRKLWTLRVVPITLENFQLT